MSGHSMRRHDDPQPGDSLPAGGLLFFISAALLCGVDLVVALLAFLGVPVGGWPARGWPAGELLAVSAGWLSYALIRPPPQPPWRGRHRVPAQGMPAASGGGPDSPERLIAEMIADLRRGPAAGRQVCDIWPASRIGVSGDMPEARLRAEFARLSRPGEHLTVRPMRAGWARITVGRPGPGHPGRRWHG